MTHGETVAGQPLRHRRADAARAPVTIATLLLSSAILSLLIFRCRTSTFDVEEMNLDLSVPRSTVTDEVKRLEGRLLQRTTPHVSPTLDVEAFHRCGLTLMAHVPHAQIADRH